jgi:hypothetical protein
MSTKQETTLRLNMPQWQGGNRHDYYIPGKSLVNPARRALVLGVEVQACPTRLRRVEAVPGDRDVRSLSLGGGSVQVKRSKKDRAHSALATYGVYFSAASTSSRCSPRCSARTTQRLL